MALGETGNNILSYGSTGGDVAWLKGLMQQWGYYDPTHPDAALGANTYGWDAAEAVAKFQQQYGLSPTGQADDSTWYYIQQLQNGVPAAQLQPWSSRPGVSTPAAPSTPGMTMPPAAPATTTRDAMARLQQILNQYGLGGMAGWIQSKLENGSSEAEIQLEMYDQPEFKARFPVIEQRRLAGLTPVSPAEVMEYEQRGRELMRQAGLTNSTFTNKDYLQGLMGQDVSLAEVQTRLNDGLLRVQQAPPEVRNVFGQFFGTSGDAALAQLFLDPEKAVPELEKMASTAIVGGIGERYQVNLTKEIARQVADTGVSDAAIWQGFQKLDSISSIFNESISETQDLTKEGAGVGAVFGTQPGQTELLQRRVDSRLAAFRGGGGAAAADQGVVGLGSADR